MTSVKSIVRRMEINKKPSSVNTSSRVFIRESLSGFGGPLTPETIVAMLGAQLAKKCCERKMMNGLRELNRSLTYGCCVVSVTTALGNLTFQRGVSSSLVPLNNSFNRTRNKRASHRELAWFRRCFPRRLTQTFGGTKSDDRCLGIREP